MFSKVIASALFLFFMMCANGQSPLFSDGFEQQRLASSWQIISGNWRIAAVDDLRIAPSENGFRHVLLSGGDGYKGSNLIRLMIDLPASLQLKKIRLSFSYYILADAPGTKIEGEFYQNEMIDGLRGKPWTATLPKVKGRWKTFQRIMQVPARANSLRVVFYGFESTGRDRMVCFDDVIISPIKKPQ